MFLRTISLRAVTRPSDIPYSNPSLGITDLPDDYPVYKLQKARNFFESIGLLPPFVLLNRGPAQRVIVVLHPSFPVTAELVKILWDINYGFWTLDISSGDKDYRVIVAHLEAGRYHQWIGGTDF